MERVTRKKLLAILTIITVLATDFFVLSSGIKTYASQLSSETNNANVEFSAYFKEGENRVDSIEQSIKAEDVKLYAEIKVKNEGYLKEGTVIELENSNFNLKSEILPSNTHINSIEGNKVNLKQINNGETIEIELGIEPVIAEKITTDFLSKTSTVKMIGVYVYSKSEEGQSIRTDKTVCVNYVPDETAAVELETKIITNKVFAVKGTNQRIVQLLIKSRLTNNEYPVEQTKLKVSIPNLNENVSKVEVMAINETTKIKNTTTENGVAEITLSNEADENNQISWNKNVYDEVVVTYIYPENTDASKLEITTNAELKVYNSEKTYTETQPTAIENEEPNNIIIGKSKILTKEIYKGKLYANIDAEYNTKTTVAITNADVADEIVVHEGPDAFGTDESEMSVNTKYISTEINLEKMLEILGQDGKIEIKNGETTTTVNKETAVDENGNVIINYENGTAELDITTSKPVNAGILELKHAKVIKGNTYTRAQLQTVKSLNTKNTTFATLEGTKIVENTTEPAILKLKETTSKVELTIGSNKQTLSTTEPNEVILGITLVTNGVQYDLFKNPKMSIKFPAAVENVELISTPNKQNADEFTLDVGAFNTTNKIMQISLQGEQTAYTESELTQGYIQLNLNVTLNSLAISQTDKIIMAYTNENAVQYDGGRTDAGIVEQGVEISAPSQLIKMYNLNSNENTSLTETILQRVRENEAGKTLDFEISLINNKDSDISNLKILGELPTTENTISGQDVNTLETTLKGISAENANIYYTENSNATADIEDIANGWTQDFSSEAKLYLIKVDSLERGANYTATVTEQLPSSITENGLSYSQYEVIYDTETEIGVTEASRKIGLASSMAASITTEIIAQVGQDILSSGDTVKEGEVIKYTVTVKNNGAQTLENVQLKLDVPEGTTFVRPVSDREYKDRCYDEITDENELENLTNIVISKLQAMQPYKLEYEVKINKGVRDSEILNKTTVEYNELNIKVNEIKNIVEESNVRVTIKPEFSENDRPYHGKQEVYYGIYIENMSDLTINNLELQILSKGAKIKEISGYDTIPEKIIINEIKPKTEKELSELSEDENFENGYGYIGMYVDVDFNVEEVEMYVIIKDSNGNICRSNNSKETTATIGAEVNISSPQNREYLKQGDIVEYNIMAQNIGDIENYIKIKDNVANFLKVQEIYVNGEIWRQATEDIPISNDIIYIIQLKPEEQVQLKIITKVIYVPEMYNGTVITNMATANIEDIAEFNSQILTHVLKANLEEDKNIENIISGFVWFDKNANGRRDAEEETLSETKVKLYDVSTNSYAKNEEGTLIQTITNSNGEYIFKNIKDGSYLVVFEHDAEKYEPTKLMAEEVDTSLNSKAILKYIKENGEKQLITAIKIDNLLGNVLNMNVGLKENTGDSIPEELPDEPTDNPENPDNPTNPNEPNNPTNPDNPTSPEEPTQPDVPTQPTDTKTISGFAWLDSNINGQKDSGETYLSGIKVRLYDVSAKNYLTDEAGKIIEITTDENGRYTFNNIEKGSYIVIFEYDTEEYKFVTQNSDIVLKKISINGQEKTVAVTDTINVQNNVSNVNIGLRENLKFDLELNKYISKIVVQTSKETKTYDYQGKTLGKVEIHRKQIQGANVVLEYTIKVKNTGEIAGYASNIVDYLPSGLKFSSELNKDWYLSGDYLYTKSLEKVQINPGEEKEVKLILTKTMTSENVGLINNRAEIYQDYNKYGESDIDSTPNNQAQNEDDFGTTDVIIQVATGGSTIAYIILAIINIVLICVAIRIMIMNDIIKIKTKEERR